MIKVIVVDDHQVVRRGLKQVIAAKRDMQVVGGAENARGAIRVIRYPADCGWKFISLADLEKIAYAAVILRRKVTTW